MLCRINELSTAQVVDVRIMLANELAKLDVASHFQRSLTVDSLLHDYGDQYTQPEYFQMTWVSYNNDTPIGIFQAHIMISDTVLWKCVDTLVINFSDKKLVFGRDWRSFYDILYDLCHKIELSALVPQNSEYEGVTANRHLARYDVNYIGRKRCVNQNLNGVWMDQLLWEIITPKGWCLINKS